VAIAVAFRQQGPGDPSRLIGLGHAGAVHPTPGFDPWEPATPGIRVAIDPPEDRAGTMDEQRTKIAVPPLRHPEQRRLPARGMLPRDQAQPGGALAAILALRRIADGRDERCGGQGANPGQLRQPLTGFVSLEYPLDLLVGRRDPLIQGLELLGERV